MRQRLTDNFQTLIRKFTALGGFSKRGVAGVQILILAAGLTMNAWSATAPSNGLPTTNVISTEEVESLIRTLEDEESRARLIQQLRLLTQAQSKGEEAEKKPGWGARALSRISKHLETGVNNFNQFILGLSRVTAVVEWARNQWEDPEARALWKELAFRLGLIILAGYFALFLMKSVLARAQRSMMKKTSVSLLRRLGWLCLNLGLEILPLVALAVAAYLVTGVFALREATRLVALAWMNAVLFARALLVVVRFLVCPEASKLRLFEMDDETAHYLEIWARRLGVISVYGYFALNAALLLGLPESAFRVCLQLLVLFVGLLAVVFVFQIRANVSAWIRGHKTAEPGAIGGVRRRLAALWHWVVILYLIFLYAVWVLAVPGGFAYLFRSTAFTVVILVAGVFVFRLTAQLWERGFRISKDLKKRYPGLETRLNRYFPVLRKLLAFILAFIELALILQVWGIGFLAWLGGSDGRDFLSTLGSVAGILAGAFILWEAVNMWIENYLSETNSRGEARIRSARARTLLSVARKALFITLATVTTLLVLSEIGVNITPLLAAAGVLGLAVGFGSQKLVQDVITGAFILLEDLFSVGDVIKVGGTAGLVEAVSIRNVRLRDLSGMVHTIPFSSIDTISNLTKEFSFFVFDLGIAYKENVDEVMEILKEVGKELEEDPEIGPLILDSLEVFGVDAFANSAVIIKGRIKTLPIKQWAVGRAFNRLVKIKFDERGIEIPFPHQTIYFGAEKDGTASPAFVELRKQEPETEKQEKEDQ